MTYGPERGPVSKIPSRSAHQNRRASLRTQQHDRTPHVWPFGEVDRDPLAKCIERECLGDRFRCSPCESRACRAAAVAAAAGR